MIGDRFVDRLMWSAHRRFPSASAFSLRFVTCSLLFWSIGLANHVMHISEGFLPLSHAALWTCLAVPFASRSVTALNRMRENRYLIAASAGYLFTLTALKLPSAAGSSAHATGVALGTILLGPVLMPALTVVVLLFQALLTAHGGLTTLGANMISLGVAGPWCTWLLWRGGLRIGLADKPAVMVATALGSLATYACTSLQLALAHPDPSSGIAGAFQKFAAIFAVTQIPVSAVEAVFTVIVLQVFARSSAKPEMEAWANR